MNSQIEKILEGMSPKNTKTVLAGLEEFALGKEKREEGEEDFWELARLVAAKDPEALAMLEQPSPWNYAVSLLAANLA